MATRTGVGPGALVGTSAQICLVLALACGVGLYFGLLFGTLGVEDDTRDLARLHEDTALSVPVGAVAGLVVGVLNAYLAEQGPNYEPVAFEDDRDGL